MQTAPDPPRMTPGVQEDVGQRISDFPRRSQDSRMESFRKNPTAATERPVQCTRDARADGRHAASERPCVRCFDEKVGVGDLQGVVNEPEVAAVAGGGEALLERTDEAHRA
jgi:hypothetical protein